MQHLVRHFLTVSILMVANLSGGPIASADTGRGYELEGEPTKPIFLYQRDADLKDGVRTLVSTYTDPEGKVLVVETSEFNRVGERDKTKSYKISHKQLGAEGVVEVKDGKVHFTYTRDGKQKTADEKATDELIVGPGITNYIQSNWATIAAGKTLKGRLAVPDRLETVGFEYFKEKEEDVRGEKATVVKMKPSSFIIAALVDPLRFYFTGDGKRLIQIRGRTQPKRQVGPKYKDLDALLILDPEK